jgi:hypothetical protein
MSASGKSGDPGKFYSLFGSPESYQTYGPGQADYITVPGPNQTGPLINIPQLMPGATRGDVEGLFGKPPKAKQSLPPRGKATAELDNGIRNDAMTPQTVQGTKGDMQAPGDDPLSMMAQALMSMFSGGMPSPSMGGGTTEAPMGGSPFTQMPTTMDVPERNPFQQGGPDEEILANMIRGPGQSQQMTQVPPMMQEAQGMGGRMSTPPPPPPVPNNPEIAPTPHTPAMRPPVPSPNPSFHADPNSLEALLTSMFGAGQPQVPARNPLFSGGV